MPTAEQARIAKDSESSLVVNASTVQGGRGFRESALSESLPRSEMVEENCGLLPLLL
jgi:hypothetical protein